MPLWSSARFRVFHLSRRPSGRARTVARAVEGDAGVLIGCERPNIARVIGPADEARSGERH